jgi:hypothetical protein
MSLVVGDVGTTISLDVGQDLTAAGSAKMVLMAPGEDPVIKTATTSGQLIRYTTVEGDIEVDGRWVFQGWVDLGAWKGYTRPVYDTVYPRLADVTA